MDKVVISIRDFWVGYYQRKGPLDTPVHREGPYFVRDRLGYCFTPYQRLWLYNGAPLVAFYDTLGIRRTYSRLKSAASSRGYFVREHWFEEQVHWRRHHQDARVSSWHFRGLRRKGLCGLIYVGETKGQLRSRMNGHRFQINHGGNQLLYRHFNLPDHSILSMKVRILEKIYHPTNNPSLSTPFRRKREEHWIRQLGTAAPYGCNDHIDSIGNLTSPGCQSVNVLNLFDRTSRRHRSHGSRKYNKPEIHDVSFDGLLPFVNLQLGLHHIRTKLYSLPLKRLHALYESTLTLHFADVGSPGHPLQGIILDISSNRLFKAVRIGEPTETRNRPFLNVKFANKGIEALNFSNILNQKSVQNKIPPYFQYKESPCISYTSSVSPACR